MFQLGVQRWREVVEYVTRVSLIGKSRCVSGCGTACSASVNPPGLTPLASDLLDASLESDRF